MRPLSKARLKRAAEIFRSYGAAEVYLFGSYATGKAEGLSDVDFAVAGLPSSNFFPAMGRAIEELGRTIDVVNLDRETPFTSLLKGRGELVRLV
jgi:predicted nucleotidyltransferase